MVTRSLRLTRAQIAAFVGDDPDAIRQIEQLFATVDAVPDTTGTALALAEQAATAPADYMVEAIPVETLDWVTFPRYVPQQGRMGWEPLYGTIGLGMAGNTMHRLGLNSFVRVQNTTGGTIGRGSVVASVAVGSGGFPLAVPFLADGATAATAVMGMMAEDLPNGGLGYACSYGPVMDLDTSAYLAGATLYASGATPGAWTTTPAALAVPLGTVTAVSSTQGVVLSRVHQMGLAELAAVAPPAGGGTVDSEARTAIGAIIARLQQSGILA
jgi:hypothetical protein